MTKTRLRPEDTQCANSHCLDLMLLVWAWHESLPSIRSWHVDATVQLDAMRGGKVHMQPTFSSLSAQPGQ